MSRSKTALLLIIVISFSLTVYLATDYFSYKKASDKYDSVLEKLVTIKQNDPKKEVLLDIKTVTAFSWDKLNIFEPYTPADKVTKALGFKWTGAPTIGTSDIFYSLVFTKGNKVVKTISHPRSFGDFSLSSETFYTPQTAKFKLLSAPRFGFKDYLYWAEAE